MKITQVLFISYDKEKELEKCSA